MVIEIYIFLFLGGFLELISFSTRVGTYFYPNIVVPMVIGVPLPPKEKLTKSSILTQCDN
jgi:hypothetical protein